MRGLTTKVLALLGLMLVIAVGYLALDTGGWLRRPAPAPRADAGPAVAPDPAPSSFAAEAQEAPPPPVAAAPEPAAPDVPALVILIRSTVLALAQANRADDYSVLRALGAPDFQNGNSAEAIGRAFTGLRQAGVDLSAVAVVNPTLDEPPILGEVDGRSMMRLKGLFPAVPQMVRFDIVFEEVDGRWRLFGLAVNPTGEPSPLPRPAPPSAGAKPALPEAREMLALVRDAVVALNQANQTGNYAVLNRISAPGFASANSPEKLATIFAALRDRNLDLAPVTVIDPALYRPPAIMENGMLRLTGFFPSQPERVNFDLAFEQVEGRWRLFGIGVNTSREVADASPAPGSETTAALQQSAPAASDLGTPPMPRLRPPPAASGPPPTVAE